VTALESIDMEDHPGADDLDSALREAIQALELSVLADHEPLGPGRNAAGHPAFCRTSLARGRGMKTPA
jgi:hypothetical protein